MLLHYLQFRVKYYKPDPVAYSLFNLCKHKGREYHYHPSQHIAEKTEVPAPGSQDYSDVGPLYTLLLLFLQGPY